MPKSSRVQQPLLRHDGTVRAVVESRAHQPEAALVGPRGEPAALVTLEQLIHGGQIGLTLPTGQRLAITIGPETPLHRIYHVNIGVCDFTFTLLPAPHPRFQLHLNDLLTAVDTTRRERQVGTIKTITGIRGDTDIAIPPGSEAGTTIKLSGEGLATGKAARPRGDLVVTIA